ncbi:MAG: MBL fold metallo-hydrolase [Victivallales bacterium]|nr:MBL fold metallo-hydrolase [Victivallales bacterium]
MKVTLMGSAAAEAVPALWCDCDVCRQARRNGGKDIRMRTSYLIDRDTMVDFGPDAFSQTLRYGVDWTQLRRIVFTHAHEDHLNPVEFMWREPSYSRVTSRVKIIGSPRVLARLERETGHTCNELQLDPVPVGPGDRLDDGDLSLLCLKANHEDNSGQALNFVLSRGGKNLLIANDTGWWDEEVWQQIASCRLDAAIIDATMGVATKYLDWRNGHMGARTTTAFRDKLLQLGAITPATPVCANHFSHNGEALHHRLEDFFAPHRIMVGYDGMTLTL